MVLTSPPPAVQTVVFGILSPIGKLFGYRATYPQYEGPHGHAEVPADLRDVTVPGAPGARATA
jgi:hypothetical protein